MRSSAYRSLPSHSAWSSFVTPTWSPHTWSTVSVVYTPSWMPPISRSGSTSRSSASSSLVSSSANDTLPDTLPCMPSTSDTRHPSRMSKLVASSSKSRLSSRSTVAAQMSIAVFCDGCSHRKSCIAMLWPSHSSCATRSVWIAKARSAKGCSASLSSATRVTSLMFSVLSASATLFSCCTSRCVLRSRISLTASRSRWRRESTSELSEPSKGAMSSALMPVAVRHSIIVFWTLRLPRLSSAIAHLRPASQSSSSTHDAIISATSEPPISLSMSCRSASSSWSSSPQSSMIAISTRSDAHVRSRFSVVSVSSGPTRELRICLMRTRSSRMPTGSVATLSLARRSSPVLRKGLSEGTVWMPSRKMLTTLPNSSLEPESRLKISK
mmetsp:Transcript_34673/g.95672  ORF Transcript_34673/g.95672 Transcript_34673/m.95672 type:complete len:382 (-) Transcript_34673:150-1295(-)